MELGLAVAVGAVLGGAWVWVSMCGQVEDEREWAAHWQTIALEYEARLQRDRAQSSFVLDEETVWRLTELQRKVNSWDGDGK